MFFPVQNSRNCLISQNHFVLYVFSTLTTEIKAGNITGDFKLRDSTSAINPIFEMRRIHLVHNNHAFAQKKLNIDL